MKQLDKSHIFITIKKMFYKTIGKKLLDFSVVLNFITRKVCVGWGTGKYLKVCLGNKCETAHKQMHSLYFFLDFNTMFGVSIIFQPLGSYPTVSK